MASTPPHTVILPSANTRTDSYSVCNQGQLPPQYRVHTVWRDPRATCDAAPRAESILDIHSSLSFVGPDARATKSEKNKWQCSSRRCLGSDWRKHSIVSRIVSCAAAVRPFLSLDGPWCSYKPTVHGSSAATFCHRPWYWRERYPS